MGYILDSIKALFTKNTTNAASVSGARVPIMSADGTPIGNDSLANLASVLGALTQKGTLGVDCDTLYDIGVYNVGSSTAAERFHTPTNYGTLMVMSSTNDASSYIVQVFIERVNGNFRVFIRTGNRSNGYYAWKKLATTTDE